MLIWTDSYIVLFLFYKWSTKYLFLICYFFLLNKRLILSEILGLSLFTAHEQQPREWNYCSYSKEKQLWLAWFKSNLHYKWSAKFKASFAWHVLVLAHIAIENSY